MNLRDLLHGVTAEPVAAIPIAGIACHSKQVRPGDLFIAVDGETTDGHRFIGEAIARGAAAVVAQRQPPALSRSGTGATVLRTQGASAASSRPCPCVLVRDSREALVQIGTRFYGHPSRKLRLIGVTGTNGKTTTTYLLKAILETAGFRAGLLGTIVYQIGDRVVPSTNTTPGPLELARLFAQMAGEGLQWCAMEVSSHALAQGRVDGLEFEAAIFTNLGSDHLDYHKTRDAYAAAKRRLFEYLRPDGVAVLNADDAYGRVLAETIPQRTVVTYGMERPAKVSVKHVTCTWQGTALVLDTPWGVVPLTTPLVGRHNVWNLAAASSALLALGVPADAIQHGLASLEPVPGRLERVPGDTDFAIVVDYAHTADALRLALLSLRELTRGRLIAVFGCGGNRDQTKRPVMGKMASLLADHVVLTSDNPRGEHPLDIIRQIQAGFPPGFHQFDVVPDREQAIVAALSSARRDDTVLIAGKGHEAYQQLDHVAVPCSDRDIVERWVGARHSVAVSS
ncbi:MAG: UDP-N-acetylmuramoyl-L-alanyl-D-glutamate--2,6-diaminopimelate ligase [Candidatus Omnitrophica bacterium]|nr:UDP-N-acetylmuramoyl-L-alanyl-D-glutamate--2,6-diaminopimelate ligase [Candidatus Omnitrophota bacterium]